MTVIACKNGIMAADEGVWGDGLCFGTTTKIQRLADGSLCAAAGPRPLIQAFHRWMESGQKNKLRPRHTDEENFGGLWLKLDGSIWRVSHLFEVYDSPWPFSAEGIRTQFMLGAMAAGASAELAVQLAIKHSDGAFGSVQVERLDGFCQHGHKEWDLCPVCCH